MSQRNLSPEVIFEGIIKQNGTVSNDAHLITRGYLHSNVINGIHPDSANYAEVVSDGGVDKLKLKPLTVTDVTVNSTATDLDDFADNVYDGSNFQEGDIVFLTSMSPTECYIHNGGNAGDAGDWELVNSGLSTAQVRAMLSASSGIDYNSSTGEFTADQAEIQGFFSAGTGLTYSAGQFAVDQSAIRGMVGASGLLSYDSSTGVFDLQNSDVRGAVQADPAAGNLLTYNSSTGDIAVMTSAIFAEFSAGGLLSFSNGEYSIQNSDVRGAIQADPAAGNLLTYNSSTGDIAVQKSVLRKTFTNQSLTANTALTLTHSLGEKLVHVSAMDSNSEKIDLKVVYVSTTQVSVTSVVNITGVDIAVSL